MRPSTTGWARSLRHYDAIPTSDFGSELFRDYEPVACVLGCLDIRESQKMPVNRSRRRSYNNEKDISWESELTNSRREFVQFVG